jgi:hypothetical protein
VTSALLPTRELDAQHPHRQTTEPARSAAVLTQVAWSPRVDLDLAEWSAVGRRFGEIGRCSQWWLGDWINYGNHKFGERYTRAVKLTGYDVQSLMNMVYVASRFEIYRRRENLSWSHHSALAALDVDRQEYWLERATADKLSVADLRVELRGRRQALEGPQHAEDRDDGSADGIPGVAAIVCPHCGGAVPLSD